jgi:hypothetical protein
LTKPASKAVRSIRFWRVLSPPTDATDWFLVVIKIHCSLR